MLAADAEAAAAAADVDPNTGRELTLVLGDQLNHTSVVLASTGSTDRAVLMIEAPGEAAQVWSHKARIAIFLSAMRHFRDELRARGTTVHYVSLGDSEATSFEARLREQLRERRPTALRVVEPGEWRIEQDIRTACAASATGLRIIDDAHFMCSGSDFKRWARAQGPQLRMEFFYREMRRRHQVLLDADVEPEGGRWNLDVENRRPYPKAGPGLIPPPEAFGPDDLTREVFADVEARFAEHPGSLADFAWPVTRDEALRALDVFIESRLPEFGVHQDAMWSATPFGWHALLSSSLNLHLLDPREVIAAAEAAYRRGDAPLASVEGFIRQVLGWREFMRGVYWLEMPALADANRLQATRPLPAWYWTGATRMACARDAVEQTLRYGYAHHIQRLMVTGLFAMLAKIDPKQVAAWYLAVYVDAVEWAELPNVAGMALYADGGRFTSKPYLASGAYIQRMSNHCERCHYAPTPAARAKSGKPACPFTLLYWNFLDKHKAMLAANARTAPMVKNLSRLSAEARARIKLDAAELVERLDSL